MGTIERTAFPIQGLTTNAVTIGMRDDVVFNAIVKSLWKLAGKEIEIFADSNLSSLIREIDDSLGLLEFSLYLEDELGVVLDREEIGAFFWPQYARDRVLTYKQWISEIEPQLTIASFADFLRQRYEPPSFEPVSVLGSPPCPAAGYFVGMSEIVEQIKPDVERFGPSTPINGVLSSYQLTTFWMRLSRAAHRSLPQLSFWLNRLANVLLIGSAACLLFGVFVDWAFLAAAWMLCLKGLLFAKWLHLRANPLPKGIVTFSDLSRYLAGQKEIPAQRSLARRAGAWFGQTILRRRSSSQAERPQC